MAGQQHLLQQQQQPQQPQQPWGIDQQWQQQQQHLQQGQQPQQHHQVAAASIASWPEQQPVLQHQPALQHQPLQQPIQQQQILQQGSFQHQPVLQQPMMQHPILQQPLRQQSVVQPRVFVSQDSAVAGIPPQTGPPQAHVEGSPQGPFTDGLEDNWRRGAQQQQQPQQELQQQQQPQQQQAAAQSDAAHVETAAGPSASRGTVAPSLAPIGAEGAASAASPSSKSAATGGRPASCGPRTSNSRVGVEVVPQVHQLLQQLLLQAGYEEQLEPQVLPLLVDLFQRESLRILCAAAEIVDYRAAGSAQERQQRGAALARGPPLRIEEGDAAAALQEYLQLEAHQSPSTQDLSRLSRLANTMTFSSSAAELLQHNRLGTASRASLDEDSDVGTAAAAAAAASAGPGTASLPFGRKNLLGNVPGGLPPYLPEDVNACTLMPPWSLSLADKGNASGGAPSGTGASAGAPSTKGSSSSREPPPRQAPGGGGEAEGPFRADPGEGHQL